MSAGFWLGLTVGAFVGGTGVAFVLSWFMVSRDSRRAPTWRGQ